MRDVLIWDTLLVFLITIPFGYWRKNVNKFSFQWMLAIHIPVMIVIAVRLFTPLGFAWYTYIFMISGFFLGQKTGSLIRLFFENKGKSKSSCLVMDICRLRK